MLKLPEDEAISRTTYYLNPKRPFAATKNATKRHGRIIAAERS
jgi:hypothetical protein